MARQIDQDVDLVGGDLPRRGLVGQAGQAAPMAGQTVQVPGHVVDDGIGAVADDLEPAAVVIGQHRRQEVPDRMAPQVARDIADAQPLEGIGRGGEAGWAGQRFEPPRVIARLGQDVALGDAVGIMQPEDQVGSRRRMPGRGMAGVVVGGQRLGMPSLFLPQIAETGCRFGLRWGEGEGGPIGTGRRLQPAQREQGVAAVAMGAGIAGPQSQRAVLRRERLLEAVEVVERDAEIAPGLEEIGPQPRRFAIGGDRLVQLAGPGRRHAEIIVRLGTGRRPFHQVGESHRGRTRQAEAQISLADPGVGLGKLGVLAQGACPGAYGVFVAALGEQGRRVVGHGRSVAARAGNEKPAPISAARAVCRRLARRRPDSGR